MKTKISTLFVGLGLAASSLMSTSCIEETFPTDIATNEVISSSAKATEALLWAMPAFMNNLGTLSSSYHYDWGYGSVMHIRDVMTGDLPAVASGYNWYTNWELNKYQGESYVYCQFLWNFYWKGVQTTNNLISAVNPETATDAQLGMLGVGLAYRAHYYLDMAQMWEFLPNDVTSSINQDGNDVLNLTVPIVKEGMGEDETRNNPRVSREEMAAFIINDLNRAEEYIVNIGSLAAKTLPDLAVVYGLKARYYMWLAGEGTDASSAENFKNAKEYARKAINAANVTPMTQEECLDLAKGFNDINQWMWGVQMVVEDNVVQSGILNWTSWMSNEAVFGYSAAEPNIMIDASMYARLNNTDFRKLMWKAPKGTALYGMTPYIAGGDALVDYASVKFRPANGDVEEPTVGAVSAYPLMRVEEMYFIEAEAAAHLGEDASLLVSFMKNYRDKSYTCQLAGAPLVEEVVFQKRVELWGEGLSFFDYKRLNMPVKRGYEGSNWQETARFNTATRPAWMNLSIVQTEKNNNKALVGWGNPDPSEKYTAQ